MGYVFFWCFLLVQSILPQQSNNVCGFSRSTSFIHFQKIHRTQSIMSAKKITPSEKKPAKESILQKLVGLLHPGEGQRFGDRQTFHAIGSFRSIFDTQIYTHIPFLYAIYLAFANHLYDLFLLLTLVIPLSVAYHLTYERPGLLAQVEGFMAKMLFLYGLVQIPLAKSITLLALELVFLVITAIVFVSTNIYKETLYDSWHWLMHVVPAFWAILVAAYHSPIVVLF
jgi:hypothetical protein